MGRNSVAILMATPLPYLLITVKVIAFWKLSFSDIQNVYVELLVNTFTADDKHFVLRRDNLTQPIQMQLSQKQKKFLNFFLDF